jgi:hypothetical protein
MTTHTVDGYSPKQTEKILLMATAARRALRLENWDVIVMKEIDTEDDDVLANITPLENHFVAQLRLGPDWLEQTTIGQRYIMTHEMIHLFHRGLNDVWDATVWTSGLFGMEMQRHLDHRYTVETERMVSNLSNVMFERIPKQAWDVEEIGEGVYVQGNHRG